MSEETQNLNYERGQRGEALCARLMSNLPNPRIYESEWRATFLPMFVGGGDFINMDAWRAVAGTLQNEVDVYTDVRNDDTYLFTVPPVQLDVLSTISVRGPGGGMANTLSGALINAAEDPGSIEAHQLVASQIDQAPEMVAGNREELMKRWEAVFERYGIDYHEVRKQVAKLKYGIDVKDDINNQSSKKGSSGWGPDIDEGFEFDDKGTFSY